MKRAFPVACFIIIIYYSCNDYNKQQDIGGERLAKTYCGSCHQYPAPDLLTKQIWKRNVLPVMSNFMNLHYVGDSVLPLPPSLSTMDSAILPVKLSIAANDFKKIEAYYLENAPDSMPPQSRKLIPTPSSDLFAVQAPVNRDALPFTPAVMIDPLKQLIYQADAANKTINVFDKTLHLTNTINISNIATDLTAKNNELRVTDIGSLKPGTATQPGNILTLQQEDLQQARPPKVMLDSLNRPVESIEADLDNDGRKDLLVCEFGFLRGGFSWYRNEGNGKYAKKLLKAVPGAIRAYVEDVNHDGKMDIWVLFGQAKEGISLFINKGDGIFEEKEILTFPPVYGSSYFELADMNNDGKEDIIYTCGDNADYSQILKPYHGVYIFLNEGNYHFKQKYFFPMYGCYKAMAVDFDKDGDLDLACIAYFGDYDHHPRESFIYLDNTGKNDSLGFIPHTINNLSGGRWICMDVKDLDGDGWPDIVLGNMAAPYQNRHDWQAAWMQAPPFTLLKNMHK